MSSMKGHLKRGARLGRGGRPTGFLVFIDKKSD